jgi:hypothetical protein
MTLHGLGPASQATSSLLVPVMSDLSNASRGVGTTAMSFVAAPYARGRRFSTSSRTATRRPPAADTVTESYASVATCHGGADLQSSDSATSRRRLTPPRRTRRLHPRTHRQWSCGPVGAGGLRPGRLACGWTSQARGRRRRLGGDPWRPARVVAARIRRARALVGGGSSGGERRWRLPSGHA